MTNLHRLVWTYRPDEITAHRAPEGVTETQLRDIESAVATARCVGSHTALTQSGGVYFRATRDRRHAEAVYRVAAVVRERERIAQQAAELLDLLDRAVPDTTVHYAVEDARRALRELAAMYNSIVTQDTTGQ